MAKFLFHQNFKIFSFDKSHYLMVYCNVISALILVIGVLILVIGVLILVPWFWEISSDIKLIAKWTIPYLLNSNFFSLWLIIYPVFTIILRFLSKFQIHAYYFSNKFSHIRLLTHFLYFNIPFLINQHIIMLLDMYLVIRKLMGEPEV